LKDLRRWIRFYDEKLVRLDVQRVLAESNFVKGDILEIMADWSDDEAITGFRAKIALLCLELLVPLTWTLEIEDQKMTVHHHKHLPYLKHAQVEYKRAILQHESRKILRQIIRVALQPMSEPKNERSIRDDGIIRLMLYALRNITMISQPRDVPSDGDEAEISRSTTIDAFHSQDVLQLILTIASSMGEEFVVQDVVVLEFLFHLLKGIDPTKLFKKDDEVTQTKTLELRNLLSKEKAMLAGYKKHAPTRHNRFGTMVWLKKDDERVSTLSGQAVISGPNRGLSYLDKAKKWNKPRHGVRNKEELGSSEFDKEVLISGSARKHLRQFVEEFLDSSFNPLFTHLRRSIERELDRVLDMHHMQYFYLISWFLRAECARRAEAKVAAQRKGKQPAGEDTINTEDFSIIAGVLNQETFVLLNRYLQECFDNKAWHNLNAGMKCFTQIVSRRYQVTIRY
jgi:replication fork protection complex subunit Tof1/Swi1